MENEHFSVGVCYNTGQELGKTFSTLRAAADYAKQFHGLVGVASVCVWRWFADGISDEMECELVDDADANWVA